MSESTSGPSSPTAQDWVDSSTPLGHGILWNFKWANSIKELWMSSISSHNVILSGLNSNVAVKSKFKLFNIQIKPKLCDSESHLKSKTQGRVGLFYMSPNRLSKTCHWLSVRLLSLQVRSLNMNCKLWVYMSRSMGFELGVGKQGLDWFYKSLVDDEFRRWPRERSAEFETRIGPRTELQQYLRILSWGRDRSERSSWVQIL